MSRSTFEQLRIPAALILMVVAAVILWPRPSETNELAGSTPSPAASVVAGAPGGEVVPASVAPSPTPLPTRSAPPSEEAAPTPTEAPTQEPPPPQTDGFTAEVLVCRSISGSTCNQQLSTVPANVGSFTALVRFTDANAGDTMNAVLTGPAGTISGGPFTLGGGGNGYYYTTFPASNLPGGSYVVTAVRNGTEVAATSFVKES